MDEIVEEFNKIKDLLNFENLEGKIIFLIDAFKVWVYENELDGNYNYFIFRRGQLTKNGCGRYVRRIYISYVYDGEQIISDYEDKSIIEKTHTRLQNRSTQGSPFCYQQEEPQVQIASGLKL